MTWTPISRGKPQAKGSDPEYRRLLRIEVELSQVPPDGWEAEFNNPEGLSVSMSMHPPRLRGRTVYLTPQDDQLEEYVKALDDRVAAANKGYERRILPRLQAAEQARRQADEEETRRREDAQRRLDKL